MFLIFFYISDAILNILPQKKNLCWEDFHTNVSFSIIIENKYTMKYFPEIENYEIDEPYKFSNN